MHTSATVALLLRTMADLGNHSLVMFEIPMPKTFSNGGKFIISSLSRITRLMSTRFAAFLLNLTEDSNQFHFGDLTFEIFVRLFVVFPAGPKLTAKARCSDHYSLNDRLLPTGDISLAHSDRSSIQGPIGVCQTLLIYSWRACRSCA